MFFNHEFNHFQSTPLCVAGIFVDPTPHTPAQKLLITHTSPDLFWWLNQAVHIYLPQKLYELVQKMAQFGIINSPKATTTLLITHFAQPLPESCTTKITLYPTDDGSFLSYAAVFSFDDGCKLATITSQSNHGHHKKRLKALKNHLKAEFNAANASLLLLGAKNLTQPANQFVKQAAINQQLSRFLKNNPAHAKLAIDVSDLAQAIHLHHAATAAGYVLNWEPQFAQLLAHFFPFEQISTPKTNQPQLSQRFEAAANPDAATFMPPQVGSTTYAVPTLIAPVLPWTQQDAKQWVAAFETTPAFVLNDELTPL